MHLRAVIIEFSSPATAGSNQFASSNNIAPVKAFCNCERKPARPTEILQVSGGKADVRMFTWLRRRSPKKPKKEWTMKALGGALLGALLSTGFAMPAFGQEAKLPASPTQRAAPSTDAPKVLTGKERLGPKWTDEQRVDNCNVPVEKRGTKPRPSACAQSAISF
jgi:hypothetical protein